MSGALLSSVEHSVGVQSYSPLTFLYRSQGDSLVKSFVRFASRLFPATVLVRGKDFS